ncbi:MAG: hypothetical protein PHS45_01735 [Bacilli bacterium]|nr:hypothetical protein [Bacilli bacterium]
MEQKYIDFMCKTISDFDTRINSSKTFTNSSSPYFDRIKYLKIILSIDDSYTDLFTPLIGQKRYFNNVCIQIVKHMEDEDVNYPYYMPFLNIIYVPLIHNYYSGMEDFIKMLNHELMHMTGDLSSGKSESENIEILYFFNEVYNELLANESVSEYLPFICLNNIFNMMLDSNKIIEFRNNRKPHDFLDYLLNNLNKDAIIRFLERTYQEKYKLGIKTSFDYIKDLFRIYIDKIEHNQLSFDNTINKFILSLINFCLFKSRYDGLVNNFPEYIKYNINRNLEMFNPSQCEKIRSSNILELTPERLNSLVSNQEAFFENKVYSSVFPNSKETGSMQKVLGVINK